MNEQVIEIRNPRIDKIWRRYQQSMWRRAGIRVNMPAHTDPTKTYQYRWVQSFIKKIDAWQFDDDLAGHMVDAVVDYAKAHNLLRKGASILAMQNILKVCHDSIYARSKVSRDFEMNLIDSREFLFNNCGRPPQPEKLVHHPRLGGYANIVYWVKSGNVSIAFVSLSKICHEALHHLSKIDSHQRQEIPSDIQLLRHRIVILSDHAFKIVAMSQLGSDLLTT